jgi:polysaccharide pyruvyl transferase WcaK-like protein
MKEARIVLLGDTRDLHHHGCEAVVSEILHGLKPSQPLVLPGHDWDGQREACLSADLVVINGEGSLHHGRKTVADVLQLAERRRELGSPTALINTSWFENPRDFTKRLAAFDLVAARDLQSFDTIAEAGLQPILVPDLAIHHAQSSGLQWLPTEAPMASDSTIPELSRRLRDHTRTHHWDYLPTLAYPVHARPGSKSRRILRRSKIAASLGPFARPFLSDRYFNHACGEAATSAYLSRLASCSGLLTGRFHAVCFAIGLKVPFLAIASNTAKIESLLESAGLDPARRMIRVKAIDAAQAIPPFTATETFSIDRFLTTAKEQRDAMFRSLGEFLAIGGAANRR